jgi:hypothetical protein
MKPLKKMLTDPYLYVLVLLNLFFIFQYKDDPRKYTTIIWLFWVQSVLIGLFNFLELLTTGNAVAGDFKMNDQPVDPKKSRGCYSFFFLLHYEFFHLAYFIFLLIFLKLKDVDFNFLKISMLLLLANQAAVFIRHKQEYRRHPPSLGALFALPYLRIIPMHLMILLPAFFNWKPALVFLALKAALDIIGHLVSTRWYWAENKPAEAEVIA